MARPSTRPRSSRNGVSDLRGAARLVIDATRGVTDVVESMHHNIARVPGLQGPSSGDRTGGITGLVYRSVRGVTRLVGGGVDALLALCEPLVASDAPASWRENVIAVVNGVIGDHLEASGNPLAVAMSLRHDGHPLGPGRAAIAQAIPQPGSHVLVLVHGLCMNDLQWNWKGHDHGAVLSAATGCTAVYARYNSGRHISQNGRDFAEALRSLIADWPVTVERITLLTHSMGGLVARSAIHYATLAGHDWPRRVAQLFFLGTPHHGAPLERGGHMIDLALGISSYSAALARLGKVRSAGITDLRHGSVLDDDWQGRDRYARGAPHPTWLPLPEGLRCYAVAAATSRQARAADSRSRAGAAYALGDGLVPVRSALGLHKDPGRCLQIPPGRQWVAYGLGHMDLLGDARVCQQVQRWMQSDWPRD